MYVDVASISDIAMIKDNMSFLDGFLPLGDRQFLAIKLYLGDFCFALLKIRLLWWQY